MVKHIGLYGGTFNPIHLGHINLAVEMLEKHRLDQVLFCPAALNPHKMDYLPISQEHRLAMLKLAISDIPQFGVLENELKRGAPSYTVDTIEELLFLESQKQENERDQYFLIIGQDTLSSFHRWHRVHQLVQLVPILVGSRQILPTINEDNSQLNKSQFFTLTPTRIMEISSTDIRWRLSNKKYCGHLLASKVLDYIYVNQLYCVS